jgi:hypothetical protein
MLTSSTPGMALQAFADLQAGGAGFAIDENLGHGSSFPGGDLPL